MPSPLVWLLFAGAGVAVAAGSSSKGGSVSNVKLPGPSFEKFADGWYYCYGSPYKQMAEKPSAVPNIIGYDYLAAVSPNATARVAAMRRKITLGPTVTNGTKPLVESSVQSMYRLASDISRAAKTVEGRKALASRLGIPIAQVDSAIIDVGRIADKYAPGTSAFVSEIASNAADYALKLLRDLAIHLVTKTIGESTAAAVAESIPIIGQIIAAYTKVAGELQKYHEESFKIYCDDWMNQLRDKIAKLTGFGYPVPWHVLDTFDITCRKPAGSAFTPAAEKWTPTTDQNNAMNAFGAVFEHFRSMQVKETLAVTDWWALSTTLMADPRVGPVFASMCQDSWGGIIGSDEQVMVVAAPIAVSFGLDVDSLARRLWTESGGWRSRVDLVRRTTLDRPRYGKSKGFFASGADIEGYDLYCNNVPFNSYAINFVVLCRDAFRIAKSMQARGEGLAKSISFVKLAPVSTL